jgi:hypothetical protein
MSSTALARRTCRSSRTPRAMPTTGTR